jgi:hypothetical protein
LGSSFVPPTSLLSIFLSAQSNGLRRKRKLGATTTWQRQQDVNAIINFYTEASPRKRSPTLISLISLFNEDYKNQDEAKNMEIKHATQDVNSVIIILFVSLLFVSSLYESRDEILFKGRFVTP